MATKLKSHLDIQPVLATTKRCDARSITGTHIGKGVKAIKVGRPAAGYALDEQGFRTVPRCGWITREEWVEIRTVESMLDKGAARAGYPTKWDGIGYLVEIEASASNVRRLMPIIKEGHWSNKAGGCLQPIWHVKKGGIVSPFYLSFEFHDKLTKIADELPNGTVKVTLFRYDKADPYNSELVLLGDPVVKTWHNQDERSRLLSKKAMGERSLSLFDAVDDAAEMFREKKRKEKRRELAKGHHKVRESKMKK